MSRRAIASLSSRVAVARPAIQATASAARWNSTTPRKAEEKPRSIKDSTSAIDYKMHRSSRSLPHLVQSQRQRSVTAEEAVTNILYNTPPPSAEPFKRHRLNCLVQNEPGVLSRVSGILAGRGFNIDSLVVCQTEIRDLSRMCIILKGQDGVIEQARRQLEDLVPVWAVLDYTNTRCVERELLLAKVSTLGPDFASSQHGTESHTSQAAYDSAIEQTATPPSFVANDGSTSASDETLAEREQALARSFEQSSSQSSNPLYPSRSQTAGMSPSEALIAKNLHFTAIKTLAEQFGGRIVDVGENDCIVQLTAKSVRVNAFLNLMRTFGVLEAARSGVMVLPRSPIPNHLEEEEIAERTEVDLSLLPPG